MLRVPHVNEHAALALATRGEHTAKEDVTKDTVAPEAQVG